MSSQQKNSFVEAIMRLGRYRRTTSACHLTRLTNSQVQELNLDLRCFSPRQLIKTYILRFLENLLRLGKGVRFRVGDGAVQGGRSAGRHGRRKGRDATRGKGKGKRKLHGSVYADGGTGDSLMCVSENPSHAQVEVRCGRSRRDGRWTDISRIQQVEVL